MHSPQPAAPGAERRQQSAAPPGAPPPPPTPPSCPAGAGASGGPESRSAGLTSVCPPSDATRWRRPDATGPGAGASSRDNGGWPYELLDGHVDAFHRSYLATTQVQKGQQQVEVCTLRQRTPHMVWSLDPRWIPRLRAAGLLPLARMVEATNDDKQPRGVSWCFPFNRSLLTALVDRWRPETHTFHLPVGEMTISLEDVSYLLGLPCSGAPVVPRDVGSSWRAEMLDRFAAVSSGYRYKDFGTTQGPSHMWIKQFQVRRVAPDADEATVTRLLEVYLLWLFGWVMFTSPHHDCVDKHLVQIARDIADADDEHVPQYSWASAVLCATYRALCDGCTTTTRPTMFTGGATLGGCPLLLQLWSYERFEIGRPNFDMTLHGFPNHSDDDIDRPTIGTVWRYRRPPSSYTPAHLAYPMYTRQFDELSDYQVRWTPYLQKEVQRRAPHGLSSLCTRDKAYWFTRSFLLFDVHVEAYPVHRVMRQFGLRQVFPVPILYHVPRNRHPRMRMATLVNSISTPWQVRMEPWIAQWKGALDDVHEEQMPHDPATFEDYIRWYLARTRIRVKQPIAKPHTPVHVSPPPPPPPPPVLVAPPPPPDEADYQSHMDYAIHAAADLLHQADSILRRLESGIQLTVEEHMSNFDRFQRMARMILRSLSFCAPSDVYPPSHWPPAVEPGVRQSSSTAPSGLHLRSSTQAASGQHSVSTRGLYTSPSDMFAGVGTSTQGAQAGRAHTQPSLTIGRGTHSSSVPTTWFRTSPPDVFAGVGTSAHGLHPPSGPFIEGDLEDDDFEVDDDPVQDVLGRVSQTAGAGVTAPRR